VFAYHVEQRLPSLSLYGLERTLQSSGNFIWFFNSLRIGAASLRSKFKVRGGTQIAAGKIARPLRHPIWIKSSRGVNARVPCLVVINHREKRDTIFLRCEVTSRRRRKHIRAVAFRGDHRRVGRAQLGSNGRAQPPTEMARQGR